jgi:hypothetical protein
VNYEDVQLIGVFDTPPGQENFCYSVDLPAPANLWVEALCTDGTRMHPLFMGFVLNALIAEDKWNAGDKVEIVDQSDVVLVAEVNQLVPKREVEAFAAETDQVRIVIVGPVPE